MARHFLPVGLLLAFLFAWLAPGPGAWLQQQGLIPWMVVTIFLVNGFQTVLGELPRGRRILVASLVAVVISLLLSPLIGLALVAALAPPAAVAVGWVVMAAVPPTLSSGIVMTRIAGGNVAKALYLTILLNLLGVFTIPFMLQMTLGGVGILSVSPWPLLQQLVLVVLLPFLLGMLLKRSGRIGPPGWLLKYLPSSCVIATVWMSASTSSDTLKGLEPGLLLLMVIGALGVHGLLLLLCWLARFVYRPSRDEWLALLFPVAQKTLPVALGVLAAMGELAGLAMVACIVFHFLQLFIDSMIASRLASAAQGRRAI